uniref:Uncharacterized protein n=1 Tax=Anguilla anguilla TaxID=7936 RepID=A0A0E9QHS7_ANGAN
MVYLYESLKRKQYEIISKCIVKNTFETSDLLKSPRARRTNNKNVCFKKQYGLKQRPRVWVTAIVFPQYINLGTVEKLKMK